MLEEKIPKKEVLVEIAQLHKIWQDGRKTLKWWKSETGYVGVAIRKICKIPIPHPESAIQIACIYYLQLDYISKRIKNRIISRYQKEVYEFLKKYTTKFGIKTCNNKPFPW